MYSHLEMIGKEIALIADYLKLTKPTIMLLVLFTGATALVLEGSMLERPFEFALVLLATYLTGGCANALNQYFERGLDARMERTSKSRPLPQNRMTPGQALAFSLIIGVVGLALFFFWFNWLSALLAAGTILFYSLVYTLLLKPRTSQNIVIGGVAGAMAPVGAWAAATGTTAVAPWMLFLIVFLWTPPHFWSLAIVNQADYVRVGLPMLPIVKGQKAAARQILLYILVLVAATLVLAAINGGLFYLIVALLLGGLLIAKGLIAMKKGTPEAFKRLFGFSIVYLFGLFLALILQVVIN